MKITFICASEEIDSARDYLEANLSAGVTFSLSSRECSLSDNATADDKALASSVLVGFTVES